MIYLEQPELSERSILLAYRGSIAHGMHLPPEQNDGFDDKVTKMTNITTKTSLTEAMNIFKRMSHGGTDCSLPFEYIQQNKIAADGVLMITDSETWHGHQHVTQARDNTIRFFNIQTTAGRAFLNDPEDTGWMEVNGFSADTLTVANLFFKGLI